MVHNGRVRCLYAKCQCGCKFRAGTVHPPKDHVDTNGISTNILHCFLRIKPVLALNGDRHKTSLYFEITRKFLKGHLSISAHDNVGTRLVNGFASGFTFLLPKTLHSKATKLNSLRRSCGCPAYSLMVRRCMPKL